MKNNKYFKRVNKLFALQLDYFNVCIKFDTFMFNTFAEIKFIKN